MCTTHQARAKVEKGLRGLVGAQEGTLVPASVKTEQGGVWEAHQRRGLSAGFRSWERLETGSAGPGRQRHVRDNRSGHTLEPAVSGLSTGPCRQGSQRRPCQDTAWREAGLEAEGCPGWDHAESGTTCCRRQGSGTSSSRRRRCLQESSGSECQHRLGCHLRPGCGRKCCGWEVAGTASTCRVGGAVGPPRRHQKQGSAAQEQGPGWRPRCPVPGL